MINLALTLALDAFATISDVDERDMGVVLIAPVRLTLPFFDVCDVFDVGCGVALALMLAFPGPSERAALILMLAFPGPPERVTAVPAL